MMITNNDLESIQNTLRFNKKILNLDLGQNEITYKGI